MPWSRMEVELLVADHFEMLTAELRNQQYSKTVHRRQLLPLLEGRTEGSIERKHQNVSAILIELGYPFILGYKPLGNYQTMLHDVVTERVLADSGLSQVVRLAVEAPAPDVSERLDDSVLNRWESPPEVEYTYSYRRNVAGVRRVRPPINYLECETRNSSLGLAGEHFALKFERLRLITQGKEKLADQVEHVSLADDGAGFDIRSFEADGSDRLIEVKTTR